LRPPVENDVVSSPRIEDDDPGGLVEFIAVRAEYMRDPMSPSSSPENRMKRIVRRGLSQ